MALSKILSIFILGALFSTKAMAISTKSVCNEIFQAEEVFVLQAYACSQIEKKEKPSFKENGEFFTCIAESQRQGFILAYGKIYSASDSEAYYDYFFSTLVFKNNSKNRSLYEDSYSLTLEDRNFLVALKKINLNKESGRAQVELSTIAGSYFSSEYQVNCQSLVN